MQKHFFTSVLLVFFSAMLFAQSGRHHLYAGLGAAPGMPDKRTDFLYDQFNPVGPVQTVINKMGETTMDDEYFAEFRYRYQLFNRVGIGMNLGYALLVNDFLLPANGNTYFLETIRPFFWRDISFYHMIQLTPTLDLNIVEKPSFRAGMQLGALNNISFRKAIRNYGMSRNKIEYFAFELYPGLYAEIHRLRFDVQVRALHLKYRDDAIANNGLNPDPYNTFKIRMSVGYRLGTFGKK
jgi:hypothetical protein